MHSVKIYKQYLLKEKNKNKRARMWTLMHKNKLRNSFRLRNWRRSKLRTKV